MSVTVPSRLSRSARALAAGSTALLALTTVGAGIASAHGSVVEPASRNYGCWERWGSDFQSPRMATEDPMCDQAWKADPNAMWNWNGLYQDGVGGNHQRAVPDGTLCSGGGAEASRYAALDTPGEWTAERVGNDFTLTVQDQANHGADYYRVYVTEQGFDPTSERLTWDDLELVQETGRFAPGQGRSAAGMTQGGTLVDIPVSAPGRTGRHVVFTIWQASHSDQTYYLCSDVVFGGGSGAPTPPATPPTTAPTPTTTTTVAEQPAPTTPTTVAPAPQPGAPATPAPGSGFDRERFAQVLERFRAFFARFGSAGGA